MTGDLVLYEAILWEPPAGYFLLERHLRRLEETAEHFHFSLDMDLVRRRLSDFSADLPQEPRKIRLEASADGEIFLEEKDVKPGTPVRVVLAGEPVDSTSEFLRYKTSNRAVYNRALAAHPEAQDVLLWNEHRELTETCNANIVLDIDGRKLTPHHSCGLLPGTFRGHLLEQGEIEEEILPIDAIEQASGLYLINSVRKWCEIHLLS